MNEIAPFIFVLTIIAGVFTFVIYLTRISNEQKKAELKIESGIFEIENDSLKTELSKLKERIAILEKIVTNDKYDLKKEFDKLDAA